MQKAHTLVPQKAEHRITLGPSNVTPRYLYKGTESGDAERHS